MRQKKQPRPTPGSLRMRKTLSMPALLQRVRAGFADIPDPRKKAKLNHPLPDVLMSALAMFSLKDPSLLAFDELRHDPTRLHNLRTLYGIEKPPCDTYMRSTLDPIDSDTLRPIFRTLHQELQKQGILESYRFMGKFLVSLDGTGYYSSSSIRCPECCQRQHKNGQTEFYHQLLGAAIVHPDSPTVLPLFPEVITRQDGQNKNDCEYHASTRLIPALCQSFPRREMIVLQDALACNGPHIQRLIDAGLSFIITCKPKPNSVLLKQVLDGLGDGQTQDVEYVNDKGRRYGYRFRNAVPLNATHKALKVNYVEYWEEKPGGKTFLYACVSDLPVNAENVADIVRAGRARWKIENETFNTLKNQGYHLEHNFGHGRQHLSSVFACLMMLAFLLDQIQQACCRYFQEARKEFGAKTRLWERIRAHFMLSHIHSWESLYAAIIWKTDAAQRPAWHDSG